MNSIVDGLSVVATVEFIKKLAARLNIVLAGEAIIILGAVVGAVLSFVQGADIFQGALVGSAAVGTHTVARTVSGN